MRTGHQLLVSTAVVAATSGQLLRDAAKERPTMLKPNTDEIGQLLGAVLIMAGLYINVFGLRVWRTGAVPR